MKEQEPKPVCNQCIDLAHDMIEQNIDAAHNRNDAVALAFSQFVELSTEIGCTQKYQCKPWDALYAEYWATK